MVTNSVLYELIGVVGFVVKPHHSFHAQLLKDRRIVKRCEGTILHGERLYAVFIHRLIRRRTKSDKFMRNNPIKISIFNFFVVLVLSQVESLVVKPSQTNSILQTAQAVQQLTKTSITVHL